jgi:hypothetical protein
MGELLFVFVFVLWYVLAVVISEKYGKSSRLNIEGVFFIAFIFSPLVGYIIAKTKTFTKTS